MSNIFVLVMQIAFKLVSKDAEIREKMKVVNVPTELDIKKPELIVGKQEEQLEEAIEAEEGEGKGPSESTESAEVVSEVIVDEADTLSLDSAHAGKEVKSECKEEPAVSEKVHRI